MNTLNDFELLVLEHLPVEPNGLSLEELADGLLKGRGPRERARVRQSLMVIAEALDGIYVRRGDVEEFGRYNVPLFGIYSCDAGRVRAFFVARPTRFFSRFS